jgi:hypothetical protein
VMRPRTGCINGFVKGHDFSRAAEVHKTGGLYRLRKKSHVGYFLSTGIWDKKEGCEETGSSRGACSVM